MVELEGWVKEAHEHRAIFNRLRQQIRDMDAALREIADPLGLKSAEEMRLIAGKALQVKNG